MGQGSGELRFWAGAKSIVQKQKDSKKLSPKRLLQLSTAGEEQTCRDTACRVRFVCLKQNGKTAFRGRNVFNGISPDTNWRTRLAVSLLKLWSTENIVKRFHEKTPPSGFAAHLPFQGRLAAFIQNLADTARRVPTSTFNTVKKSPPKSHPIIPHKNPPNPLIFLTHLRKSDIIKARSPGDPHLFGEAFHDSTTTVRSGLF